MSTLKKGYDFEFVDSIFEDLYCKSCGLVARKLSVCTCCMESFCHTCATFIQQEGDRCPVSSHKPFTIVDHPKHQKRVNNLKVCCSMKKRGCDWVGTLSELVNHLDIEQDNCPYVDVACPHNCPLSIQKNMVERHLASECIKRPYVCQHCNFKGTYEEVVDDHLPKCKFLALPCPNRCGVTCERDFMDDHMNICRLKIIPCEFNSVGCDSCFRREDHDVHIKDNDRKHLALTASAIVNTKQLFQMQLQKQEEKLNEDISRQEIRLSEQEVKLNELVERIVGQEKVLCAKERRLEEQEMKVEEQLKRLEMQEMKLEKLVNQSLELESELRLELENQQIKNKEREKQVMEDVQEKLVVLEKAVFKSVTQLEVKIRNQSVELEKQRHVLEDQKKVLARQEDIIREQAIKQDDHFKEQESHIEVLEQRHDSKLHGIKQLFLDVSMKSDQNEIKMAKLSTHIFLNRRFEMKNYTIEKTRDKPCDWKSPAMHTHVRGYKFCIGVDASGSVYGCENAIGLVMYAMQGEFDDELKWPIKVKFSIELINQRGSENLRRSEMSSLWYQPRSRHSIIGSFNQFHGGFVEHCKVSGFLNNDTLYFYVTEVQLYL